MKKTLSSWLTTARWRAVVAFVLCFHATLFAQPDRITREIGEGDHNLAPVLGISYGECATSSISAALTMRTQAKQASAQGITWIAASGDSGAGGCYQSSLGQ